MCRVWLGFYMAVGSWRSQKKYTHGKNMQNAQVTDCSNPRSSNASLLWRQRHAQIFSIIYCSFCFRRQLFPPSQNRHLTEIETFKCHIFTTVVELSLIKSCKNTARRKLIYFFFSPGIWVPTKKWGLKYYILTGRFLNPHTHKHKDKSLIRGISDSCKLFVFYCDICRNFCIIQTSTAFIFFH